jgi:aspartate/methionine/tyrosine aminotransferase
MNFETFLLERNQSLYENNVEINLTESGVHATSLRDLLTIEEINALLDIQLSYGFTEGTPEVRTAVAAWHPGATADNVLITTGASEANFVSLLSAVDKGDEVIAILPNFMQIPGAARAFGANVKTVSLLEDTGWGIDAEALNAAISSKTKLIAVCNPNNPTGALISQADRSLLLRAANAADAWLLVDEIYRGAELGGGEETPTFWGQGAKVIVTGGMAKSFGHPGLRIGWVIAPEKFIYECMRRQDYTTIGASPMSHYITSVLLTPDRRDHLLARGRSLLNANLTVLRRWVSSRNEQFSLVEPRAGGMAFLTYMGTAGSEEISRMLREQEGVFVVAGSWFGLEGRLRIGIGGDPAVLEEGLRRIGRFFDNRSNVVGGLA